MISGYLILLLFLLGLWGVFSRKNLIKKIIAFNIVNSAVVTLFVYTGSFAGPSAPILVEGVTDVVDPVPQALMLTAIVVGVCVTALGLSLVYRMYRRYGSLNIDVIERRRTADDA